MSAYWLLAIKLGTAIAFIGLMTLLVRQSLSKKGVRTFTCFVIALAVSIALQRVAVWLRH
jgi:hypothetical protein